MIKVANLSFSYGYEPVFERVNFLVPDGKKVGLVGPNGAGKSTLFKLLTHQEFPTQGNIEIFGRLSMVPQEVKNDPELSIAKTIEEYIDPQSTHDGSLIYRTLEGLEFDRHKASTHLPSLSGGQKTKLALARAFLSEPDILLLDEPTNFLDEAGTKWVMQFLAAYKKSVLIVSHDLALLDKHISSVLFVNRDKKSIDTYTGNYSAFVRTKKEQDALLRRQVENERHRIARLELSVERLRQRTSDAGVRQRVVLQRRVARMKDVLPDLPEEIKGMKASFPPPSRVGEVPIRVEHIHKAFGDNRVLEDVSLYLKRGERVALIGPNGVGKTTLIKIITKALIPDSGEVVVTESVKLGYYSQEFATFDEDETLESVIMRTAKLSSYQVIPYLGRFLFSRSRLHQRIGTLSGGEKTRLNIALLMLQDYNVLILDEPTTYLDVLSQRIILEALKDYTGAMLLVSHTKQFVTELKPHRALLLPENRTLFWNNELGEQVTRI